MGRTVHTLINHQNQPNISQCPHDLLRLNIQQLSTGQAPSDTNEELTQQPAVYRVVKEVVYDVQEEEEGGVREKGEDGRFMVRERGFLLGCRHWELFCPQWICLWTRGRDM